MKRRDFLMVASAAMIASPAHSAPHEHERIWTEENSRNTRGAETFKALVQEVFNPAQFVAGHHLIFQTGAEVQEFPSADTLIFDHDVARAVWGDRFKEVLTKLACEPVATRDALLAELFRSRA